MIGGTSIGGIIAIMFGRLPMEVQQCIDVYLELAGSVFSKVHTLPIKLLKGKPNGRYNSQALEDAILKLLEDKKLAPNTLLKDDDKYACKVFICVKRLNLDILVIFISYKTLRMDSDPYDSATILQACRATTAAPTYFEPMDIQLGPKRTQYKAIFIDGG